MADTEYKPGDMDIDGQSSTFSGFIVASVWSGAFIAMWVLFLTLALAVGTGWFTALFIATVVGALAGLFLKLGAGFQFAVAGQFALLAVGIIVVRFIGGFVG